MSSRLDLVAAEPEPDHDRPVLAAGGDRGVRARRPDHDRAVAPQGRRGRRRRGGAADPRRRACASRACCRGGFFPAADAAGRRAADDDNRRAVEEAAILGTDVLVLVCGPPIGRDLEGARAQILAGIERLAPARRGARRAAGDRAAAPDDDLRALRDRDARRGERPGRAVRRAARRRRGRRLPRVVGPAPVRGDRARGPAHPRLPRRRLARPDDRPAPGPGDDGRRA